MQMSRWTCAIAVSLAVLFCGCGGEESTEGGGGDSSANTNESAEPAGPTDAELLAGIPTPAEKSQTPTDVVRTFLNAVRDGENSAIDGEAYLTHRAIIANKREGTPFAPPANPSAEFTIVGEEFLNEGAASRVLTEWSDLGDPQAGIPPSKSDILWVLKKEENVGWGIAGAMFKPFEDMDKPVVLDFEDPVDFQKTIAWVEEETIRRMQVASRTDGPPIDRGPVNNGQGGAVPLNNGQGNAQGGGNQQPPLGQGTGSGYPPAVGGNQ